MEAPRKPRFAAGDLVRVAAPDRPLNRLFVRLFRARQRPVGQVLLVRKAAWVPSLRRLVYAVQSHDGRTLWLFDEELEPGAPGPGVPVADAAPGWT